MDLSFSKIKNSQIFNNQPAFKGVVGEFNKDNIPVFTITPPPYDKETETASLEIVPLDYDEYNNILIRPSSQNISSKDFKDDKPFKLLQDALKEYKGFAYRYKITSKAEPEKSRYFVDSFEKIYTSDTNEPFAVIKTRDSYKIDPKKGAMRQSFIDADAILNMNGNLELNDLHKPRNHFNKIGGNTKGLLALIKSGELEPYTYIMSNPVIGVGKTSSHGYWPENLYQVEDTQVFKDINYELFKQGKSYVADGAFTSQSLQSPLFQHVLKWGKKSPLYSMFKLDGAKRINLGILPNDIVSNHGEDSAYKHIGIRIINNPNNVSYDANKPTLLQFYDDRLSSEQQRNDTTKIIEAYDSQSDDIFAITHNDDSVYPFYFEIDFTLNPDFKEKIDLFREKNALSLEEINKEVGLTKFLDFGHFTVAPDRHHASNATFWDGNRDMVKLNLSNPTAYTDGEFGDKNIEGFRNARKYLFGVAGFHTEAIQADILKRTALLSPAKREEIARKNSVDNFSEILIGQKEAEYPVLNQNKGVDEYVREFPLQSLKTSPELSAVFAQPSFNEEFLSFSDNREMIEEYVNTVLNGVLNKIPKEKIENYEQYETYLTKIYANEILDYIFSYSLNPKSVDKNGNVKTDELKIVTLRSLAKGAKNPDEERKMVIDKISVNLRNADIFPLINKITNEIQNVSLKDFKDTETLMLHACAGLNWRFDAAKDIGDLDSVRAYTKNFADIWDSDEGVVDFWHDFIQEVHKYNPSAYKIGEITDMYGFYNHSADKSSFDKHYADPSVKENDFLIKIGATTNSNYNQYFNKLSCFIGVNPERGYDGGDNNPVYRAGNLYTLKDAVEGFISNSQPESAILTHEFFDNHDKPRLMHCLPLNMQLFLCGTDNRADDLGSYIRKLPESQKAPFIHQIVKLTGRTDLSNINSMALAVGLLMDKTIDKTDYSPKEKQKLKSSLRELVNGSKAGETENNFKRARAFATYPYEITIRELFKRAGMTENLDEKAKDFQVLMMKPSMEYLERLWQVMNSIVGVPSLYNGTEFAQTGYETLNKNEYVANRNQTLHGLKNDPRYKDMYDRIFASTSLYKQPQMSAIRSGFPVLCEIVPSAESFDTKGENDGTLDYYAKLILMAGGMEIIDQLFEDGKIPDADLLAKTIDLSVYDDNPRKFVRCYKSGLLKDYFDYKLRNLQKIRFLPIYKYDSKGSEVLSIITNNGIPRGELAYEFENKPLETLKVKEIPVFKGINEPVVPENTRFKKKVYKDGKYETQKDLKGNDIIYIIKDNKLKRLDGKEIELEDTVVHFFVDKALPPRCPKTAIIQ